MIPQFGWRSVLILGGVAPLILAGLMLITLPESVRYMVAKGQSVEKIRAALRRVSNAADKATAFIMTEHVSHSTTTKSGLALVLSGPFIVGSLMLWLAYFMGLVVFYALVNWMPILFKDAGIDPRTATLISALFPLGGVGAVVFGVLMDRFNPNRIIAVGYALTAVAVFGIGQAIGNVGLLMAVVFAAGILMNTAQSSMPALAAPFYPTQGRATGVAWMLGIGRFGGIAGSFLVAELSRRQFAFNEIFTIVAVAGVIAAVALLIKQAARPVEAVVERPGEILGH
jgi:AAHS family 4-hydroxybenzoate transporter-like MFS transporter